MKRQSNDLKAEAASRTDELRKQTGRAEALAAEKKTLESKLNDMTAQRDMNLAAKARALQKELAEAKAIAQANAAMASVVQTALESAQNTANAAIDRTSSAGWKSRMPNNRPAKTRRFLLH